MAGGMLLMPPALSEEGKVSVIVRRRSVLLAICAATNKEAASINEIIKTGFLTNVKGWLDDSLTKSVGMCILIIAFKIQLLYNSYRVH